MTLLVCCLIKTFYGGTSIFCHDQEGENRQEAKRNGHPDGIQHHHKMIRSEIVLTFLNANFEILKKYENRKVIQANQDFFSYLIFHVFYSYDMIL